MTAGEPLGNGSLSVGLYTHPDLAVAEHLAWSAVRFPGRIGAAVAAGYHAPDFDAVGVPFPSAPADAYERALAGLREALSVDGPLARDPAIAAWASAPAPLLSTANSITGARRAATFGLGIVPSTREPTSRLQRVRVHPLARSDAMVEQVAALGHEVVPGLRHLLEAC